MFSFYDQNAPKKSISLTVNSDLLRQSKNANIDLPAILEQALIAQPKNKQARFWLEQNKNAIAAYNKSVNEMSVFSDGVRCF